MNNLEDPTLRKGKILLGLQLLSDFGDSITVSLLALCLLDITKSTNEIGLVYFITTVGFVLFTVVGGYLGDSISKKNILRFSDTGRGLVVLLMIVALSLKSILLIYLASFFLSVLGSLHRPVKFSLWAQAIPSDKLERFNGFSEASIHVSSIFGPLIASLLVAGDIVKWGFALDAITFFVCAITFSIIVNEKSTTQRFQGNKEVFRGFKYLLRDPELLKFIVYDSIQMLTYGAFNATFLVLAQRDYGWTKPEYSMHLTLTAFFAILGAFSGNFKPIAKFGAVTRLIFCTLASALFLALSLYCKVFPLSSIFYGITCMMAVTAMVITKTKAQTRSKDIYPDSISSILAARSVLIRSATLIGTGGCLMVDYFLSLELTLWFFIAPLAIGFAPFLLVQKNVSDVEAR